MLLVVLEHQEKEIAEGTFLLVPEDRVAAGALVLLAEIQVQTPTAPEVLELHPQ
jgi:hypothetical protein